MFSGLDGGVSGFPHDGMFGIVGVSCVVGMRSPGLDAVLSGLCCTLNCLSGLLAGLDVVQFGLVVVPPDLVAMPFVFSTETLLEVDTVESG